MLYYKRQSKGFTLVELLVVIAIIAILAAILFPVFMNARERARQTHCLYNLKQLCMGFRRYADDNSGRFPRAGWYENGSCLPNWCGCAGATATTAGPVHLESGQIWPYVKNTGIFLCYTDKNRKGRYCPANYPLSYSMNTYLEKQVVDALHMKKPSKMLLLIHEARGKADQGTTQGINDGIFVPAPGDVNAQDIPDSVHYTGSTAGYLDGHAMWMSYKALIKERDEGYWVPLH